MERESAAIEVTSERVERLANLLTLSHEPMFAWRLGGPIEFWNAGAERLYGFAPDEAVGRVSHSLLQTKFPIELTELHSRLRNERYWSGELRHTCQDGREVIVDSRMQLLRDGTVLEVNRDVTEVKALDTRQATLMRDLLAPNSKPFSINLAFSQASWTCKAACGKRTIWPWTGADTRESRFWTDHSRRHRGGGVRKR